MAKDDGKNEKGKDDAVESTEGLVKMKKGGDTTHVHPTTVSDHTKLGWKTVDE